MYLPLLRIVSNDGQPTVSRNGVMEEWLGSAPLRGTPRNPFRPISLESVASQLTAMFGADASILIRQSLDGMPPAQGYPDRVKLWGLEPIYLVVGRPAQSIGNR